MINGETVTCQIASIPSREKMLHTTIKSLYKQADTIHVSLNSYQDIPEYFADYPNVYAMILDNSMGDAAKFYNVEHLNGYILTCDDDLEYFSGYVRYMTDKIEQYKRKAVVSLHGRTTTPKPVLSYYRCWMESFRCTEDVVGDHKVNVAGTGVMAFHSSTIRLNYSDFEIPNMADIWVAKIAKAQGVPLIAVAHRRDFIRVLDIGCKDSIWHRHFEDDSVQTALYNSF